MIHILVFLILCSILLALVRVLVGPQAVDRALALETLLMILMIGIGCYAVLFDGENYLIDWLLVWSLLPFIASQILAQTLLATKKETHGDR